MHTAHLFLHGTSPLHSTPFSRHPFMAPAFAEPLLWMTHPAKGINTLSVERQRQQQGPIGMHCDAPTQASKLQSAAAADARCGHPLRMAPPAKHHPLLRDHNESQTGVKTLPRPNLRLRAVTIIRLIHITSNDRSFDCPIIYTDTINNALLFIDTSTMLDTTKLLL